MVRIISRKSDLAIIQAESVGELLKENVEGEDITYQHKETFGDIDQKTPLKDLPEIGVFTQDIRNSLINGEADIAVHSWKDLPIEIGPETQIAATIERADMRDIFFLKKKNVEKIIKEGKLKVLTSSPRRSYNLEPFLKKALPYPIQEIDFEDIRGNIPTRLKKLLTGKEDGLVVAKAAIDRILRGKNLNLANKVKEILDNFLWMITPLSLNPCAPGQGALALEVSSNRKGIIDMVQKINDNKVFQSVSMERDTLSQYGGGCHQKIGVSVENMKFGNVVTLKGLTDERVILNERRIEREDLPEWYKINKDAFYPNDLEKYNLFRRHVIKESIDEVSSLKKKNIWVSRANAVPDQTKICQSNLLWVSGLKTWFKLSERGFWVNGTSDSLGENMNPGIDHLSENKKWVKLTHNDSPKNEFDEKIATYQLKRLDIKEDLSQKTHFYWMSGSAFEYALERFPTISDCFHACGPGNTYEIIKKKIKEDKITIFLSYDEVVKNLINN